MKERSLQLLYDLSLWEPGPRVAKSVQGSWICNVQCVVCLKGNRLAVIIRITWRRWRRARCHNILLYNNQRWSFWNHNASTSPLNNSVLWVKIIRDLILSVDRTAGQPHISLNRNPSDFLHPRHTYDKCARYPSGSDWDISCTMLIDEAAAKQDDRRDVMGQMFATWSLFYTVLWSCKV